MNDDFNQLMKVLIMRFDDFFAVAPTPDDKFIENISKIGPDIVKAWHKYLDAEGDLTLDQVLLPSGNYSLRKADKQGWGKRNATYAHWYFLESEDPQNISKLAREYDSENAETVARQYRAWRSKQDPLPRPIAPVKSRFRSIKPKSKKYLSKLAREYDGENAETVARLFRVVRRKNLTFKFPEK